MALEATTATFYVQRQLSDSFFCSEVATLEHWSPFLIPAAKQGKLVLT